MTIASNQSYACGRGNHNSCGKYGCQCSCHREKRLSDGADRLDNADVITRLERIRDTHLTRYRIARQKGESLRKTNDMLFRTYSKEAEEERLYAEAISVAIKALTKR